MVGITPLGWVWFKALTGSAQRTSGRSMTLKSGDVMEAEVERIGTLRNRIVSAAG